MQISHSGKQCPISVNYSPISPSSINLDFAIPFLFRQPKEMSNEEIQETIQRYVFTAKLAKKACWDGVQIHAAHGYLISQFLSPISNKRNDDYGGTIENRSRFLKEIIELTRKEVGNDFPISVKLNSADFQKRRVF